MNKMSKLGVGLAATVALAGTPVALASVHAAKTPNCVRSQLSVRSNGTNGAAGTIHGAWVFTNVSKKACALYGYPGMQLYGRSGRPITTKVKWDLAPKPTHVKLNPKASATFLSSYSDISSGSACPESRVAQITAPNDTTSLFIPARLSACGGVVHVSAVEAGVHAP
jgi:hypothetical protein